MKKFNLLILTLLFGCTSTFAQKTYKLYEGKAPGSENWNYTEIEYSMQGTDKMVRNVVDPTLEVYMPEKSVASGTAVIVCPGGGNMWLSYSNEGTDVAKWLAKKGVTAFEIQIESYTGKRK